VAQRRRAIEQAERQRAVEDARARREAGVQQALF